MTTEAPNEIKALLTNEAIQDNSQDVIASLSNKLKSLEEKKNLMNYVKQGLNTLEQSGKDTLKTKCEAFIRNANFSIDFSKESFSVQERSNIAILYLYTALTTSNKNPSLSDTQKTYNEVKGNGQQDRKQPAEAEQPAKAGEQPAEAGEQPAEAGEQPAKAGEQPAEAGEQPAKAGEQPAKAEKQPAKAGEQPAEAGEQPAEAGEQPAKAGEQPAEVEKQPAEAKKQRSFEKSSLKDIKGVSKLIQEINQPLSLNNPKQNIQKLESNLQQTKQQIQAIDEKINKIVKETNDRSGKLESASAREIVTKSAVTQIQSLSNQRKNLQQIQKDQETALSKAKDKQDDTYKNDLEKLNKRIEGVWEIKHKILPVSGELAAKHYNNSAELHTLQNDIQLLTGEDPQSPVLHILKQKRNQLAIDTKKIEQQKHDIDDLNTLLNQKITEVSDKTQEIVIQMSSIDKGIAKQIAAIASNLPDSRIITLDSTKIDENIKQSLLTEIPSKIKFSSEQTLEETVTATAGGAEEAATVA